MTPRSLTKQAEALERIVTAQRAIAAHDAVYGDGAMVAYLEHALNQQINENKRLEDECRRLEALVASEDVRPARKMRLVK